MRLFFHQHQHQEGTMRHEGTSLWLYISIHITELSLPSHWRCFWPSLHRVTIMITKTQTFQSMSACVKPLCMMLVILLIIDLFSLLLFLFKTLGHAVLSLLSWHLQKKDLLCSNHRSGHKAKRSTATALQSLKRTIDFF